MPRLRTAVPVLALVSIAVVSLLSGCAGEPSSATNSRTLAQTKSPAQLLRNEITSRVPAKLVETIGQTSDLALSCSVDDPKMLAWQSSADIALTAKGAWKAGSVFSDLIGTLTNEGWTATEWDPKASALVSELSSPSSAVKIQIKAQKDSDGDGKNSTIRINVNGACVATDGPDSPEVRKLENRE